MVYTSLTTAPDNLKEAIDWLMAVKGTDPVHNLMALGVAVHQVLSEHPVGFKMYPSIENIKLFTKRFLEQEALKDQSFVKKLLERFNKRMKKEPSPIATFFGLAHQSDYENVVQTKGRGPYDITRDVRRIVDGCEDFLNSVKSTDKYRST
ncbi:hypothetical protein, conserved [Babesia ovata]|uniref:Uncharacterized protein n=1 Tax=Babesia ovata TaxID=189622 RepID=A0A2H6KBW9_9APIC|nr:uncharacterized protein BOVATA_019780 [Babesia ovata]GBE60485.1 hypothetical protein, conserved [Babesia ovata]